MHNALCADVVFEYLGIFFSQAAWSDASVSLVFFLFLSQLTVTLAFPKVNLRFYSGLHRMKIVKVLLWIS